MVTVRLPYVNRDLFMKQDRTTELFQALADPTRRAILANITRRRMHVAELAATFPISRPAISKHLRVLKAAGLLADQEVGKKRYYQLDPRPLELVDRWLQYYRQFWDHNLANLKDHVERGAD